MSVLKRYYIIMPKSRTLKTPDRFSKIPIRKTTPKKPKKVPLKIIPPRHLLKASWKLMAPEKLQEAREKQRAIAKDKSYRVASKSMSDKIYDVVCDSDGAWTCTCADFMYRSANNESYYGFYCKHVASCIDKVLEIKSSK